MSISDFIKRNSASTVIEIYLTGSSGTGATGVLFSDINITSFARGKSGASVSGSPIANPSNDTYLSNGWKEVDPVNKKGVYQYSIPDVLLTEASSKVYIIFDYIGAGTVRSDVLELAIVPQELYIGSKLSPDGLDNIPVESYTLTEALKVWGAVLAGETSDAETSKTFYKAMGDNATNRLSSESTDGKNRTGVEIFV